MEFLLSRFRNLTVLVVVIMAQLLLLAYQVKSREDVPMIRVWAVTAVTPAARVLEAVRSGTVGFLKNYIVLKDVQEENQKLRRDLDALKLRNQYLTSELETADRVHALAEFKARTPSKTIASRVIMSGTGANSQVVFLDRGSTAGVMRGMAVITADGIVGKVINSYPTASQVLLATDPTFAASVVSQKNRVHGTVKGGIGRNTCIVDHIQNEDKVEVGEWFYTSGDDRVFPKGLPVGQVRSVQNGKQLKQIVVTPAALQSGVEEVLIVLEGIHEAIPDPDTPASTQTYMLPPPPAEKGTMTPEQEQATGQDATGQTVQGQTPAIKNKPNTEADRILDRYRKIGEDTQHIYGKPGTKPPDFNARPQEKPPMASPPAGSGTGQQAPGGPPAAPPKPAQTAPPSAGQPPRT